jgi:hypothetical protein
MATQSVQKDNKAGPDWPLGLIVGVTPGTPVGIMSLVDPTSVNAPETATTASSDEYTSVFQQIMFQGVKAGASHGLVSNTGNCYIVRKGVQGAGNRDDYGSVVAVVLPGQTMFIASAPRNRDTFSGYRYSVDFDNAGDSCLVTGFVQ